MASVRMLDADIEFKMMQYLSFLRILTNDNKIIIDHYSVRTLVHASFLNPKYLRSQCKFIVMEFSIEISSSLRMLGDDSKIDEESFKAILSETIQDLMGNKDLPSTTVGQGGTNTGCGGGTRNCCHAALTTLLIEYIKGSHSSTVFSSALEDLNWPTDRVKKTVESLDMCRPVIRSKLASTGTYPPHVIDVDWKLNYRVRVSRHSNKRKRAHFWPG
ncbi:COMM domain-containing protein 3-like isoform X2 [Macrobrachium rosenbergii]|uniref:COMM domain-containing protein 3-like isoform X2 n=1 Tax=Macrobrachium rosenbergii TaxID=79674 RepID=UPI0034D4B568